MDKIHIKVSLRPIRFLFLVRPSDKKNILKIFQINTCLWGGKFNPVLPFFVRTPKGWSQDTAKEIINNYLDFFEPDFIVEAEKGLANNIDFNSDRVLQIDNILREDEYGGGKYGQTINDLYIYLYNKKYQYKLRNKQNITNIYSDLKRINPFISCVFGSFPDGNEFNHLRENFIDIFEPEKIELNSISIAELYSSNYLTPLDVTHAKLNINHHERTPDPRLFILDINKPNDLLDYWNLRIIYREVVAVPKQWLKELSPFCKKFISKHFRPSPLQNNHMFHSTTMFSRSILDDEASELYKKYIAVEEAHANYLQLWYPSIKIEQREWVSGFRRPLISYASKKHELSIIDNMGGSEITIDTISPKFVRKYDNKVRWANIIELEDRSFKNKICAVFPTDYRNPVYPKFGFYREHLLPTTEGLVIFPEYIEKFYKWRIQNGTVSINQWLEKLGISAVVSDAGKSTQQIIETLGGVSQVWSIVNKNIIEILDRMAKTPLTRSFQINKFQNQINRDVKNNEWSPPRSEVLASQKVVELGLEVNCYKCNSWSWYSLDEIGYILTCSRCLKEFNFPITKPNKSDICRWSYRVIGPFAVPDYARGGYTAALTIHFFERSIGSNNKLKMSWSAGQELTLKSGEKAEADFILWTQKQDYLELNAPTNIVFGEAKSFSKDAFKDSDIKKMKTLAKNFPGSILVFTTMKTHERFSKDEITRLKRIAEWGRSYDKKNKRIRAHIMILTGVELFIDRYAGLSDAWGKEGGKHEEVISSSMVRYNLDNLEFLAELTQQIYLGLPPYPYNI